MIWNIIDTLPPGTLKAKAKALEERLKRLTDDDLVQFHTEAITVYDSLLAAPTYYAYCALFEGENNDAGFTDFCSNLILSGKRLAETATIHPDGLAQLVGRHEFNDDSGLSVAGVAWRILNKRHGEVSASYKFGNAGPPSLEGAWKRLVAQVGSIDYAPPEDEIKRQLPKIYLATRKRQG